MSRRRSLVTGGCGFVGRHFVKRLLEQGDRVTVVDDLSAGLAPQDWPPHLQAPSRFENHLTVHVADFREFCKEASPDFDLIVHLAAVVGGRLTIEGDPLKVATDLAIDATFFNWLVKRPPRPRKVLYFSSSAVYPISRQTAACHGPLAESLVRFDETPLGLPDTTYGWSKLSGEFLAQHAARHYDLDVVIYRPFSGYGEDQDFSYPFPSIVRRVGRKESPLVVWGSGDQLRDFIYIEDVLDAVFASQSRLQPGDVLNLGSGVGTSFKQLAELACNVLGHTTEIVGDTSKPEGVFARVGNCDAMLEHYRPTTSLQHGIETVYEYQHAQGLLA